MQNQEMSGIINRVIINLDSTLYQQVLGVILENLVMKELTQIGGLQTNETLILVLAGKL